jgi:cytoskeletal protein CcmA (bactofilin family)
MSKPEENRNNSGSLNVLVAGTKIEGTLHAESDIRIDGVLIGTLIAKSKLIIGQSGSVEGQISAHQAVIEGKFNGKIKVTDLLQVKETAHVQGEVTAGKISVNPGGVFDVQVKMIRQASPIAKPAEK